MMGVSGLGGKPLKVSLAVQKNKSSEPEFDIPQHLVQHVAQQVIGGGQSQNYNQEPNPAEQGYNAEYYQQYSQYWSQYAAWQQWQQQYAAWEQHNQQNGGNGGPPPSQNGENGHPGAGPQPPAPPPPAEKAKPADPYNMFEGPLTQLVEHTKSVDIKSENKKWLEESQEMWSSVEESCWWDPSQSKA